jgi:hypothetical protein
MEKGFHIPKDFRIPRDYLEEAEAVYSQCGSVNSISKWLSKFNSLTKAVAKGKAQYRHVENHLFELKVINYLLNLLPSSKISYEPIGIKKKGKNCDLLVEAHQPYLIELKSFHPETKSSSIPYDYITEHNEVIMDEYCYHDYQSVRDHLIDATCDTEDKFSNYENIYFNIMGVSLDYYLHLEDLRDFVTIYRCGRHRADDPLGKMTEYNLPKDFRNNIKEFWGFPFEQVSFSFEDDKSAVSVSLVQGKDIEIETYCH